MERIIQLTHNLCGNPAHFYRQVLDMRQFGKHHPYMQRVDEVDRQNTYTEYEIFERLFLFGFIPMRPRYKAKVFEKVSGRHIQYTSQVSGSLELTIDFLFLPKGTEVQIHEEIRISGSRLTGGILASAMKKSHGALFSNMNRQNATSLS